MTPERAAPKRRAVLWALVCSPNVTSADGPSSRRPQKVFPMLSVKLAGMASLEVGYRWLDIEYESGTGNETFAYDMLTQGPVAGFEFRF